MRIGTKGIDKRVRHLCDRGFLIQIAFLLGVGDKSHLEEDGRASCFEKYPERSLLHASVRAVEMSHKAFLDLLRELKGLIHETILHQFEHYIGVNRVRIEALIGRFIVRLQFHHGILAHGDIEVLLHFLGTEDKSLDSFGVLGRRGVGMYGDKEVRVVFVRDVRACLEGDKDVRGARIYHFHVRILLIQELSHLEDEGEVEVFLFREPPYRSGVFSSMPGIEDDGVVRLSRACGEGEKKHEGDIYFSSHNTPN